MWTVRFALTIRPCAFRASKGVSVCSVDMRGLSLTSLCTGKRDTNRSSRLSEVIRNKPLSCLFVLGGSPVSVSLRVSASLFVRQNFASSKGFKFPTLEMEISYVGNGNFLRWFSIFPTYVFAAASAADSAPCSACPQRPSIVAQAVPLLADSSALIKSLNFWQIIWLFNLLHSVV